MVLRKCAKWIKEYPLAVTAYSTGACLVGESIYAFLCDLPIGYVTAYMSLPSFVAGMWLKASADEEKEGPAEPLTNHAELKRATKYEWFENQIMYHGFDQTIIGMCLDDEQDYQIVEKIAEENKLQKSFQARIGEYKKKYMLP